MNTSRLHVRDLENSRKKGESIAWVKICVVGNADRRGELVLRKDGYERGHAISVGVKFLFYSRLYSCVCLGALLRPYIYRSFGKSITVLFSI